jgi:predicted GH43/DUF377 family glycosyl hydrolase
MKWKKLGRIFCPSGEVEWMRSHAALPIAEHLSGSEFRIYFGSRDQMNRSYTGWIKIDLSKPDQILDISSEPILSPGELGCFDDSGAMPAWLVNWHGVRHLYYIGWNLGVTVLFRNSIGLATSETHSQFTRYASGPIMDRTMQEPHFCASCCVMPGNDVWRMWYLSCVMWSASMGKLRHHYHIKYAESDNGIDWRRKGIIAIDFKNEDEYAISRPTVIQDKDCWRMWYSYRGSKYRIGYAESKDGIHWVRRDELTGIDVSNVGWDSDMIEYPYVFDHAGQRFMLYNGNDYGRTGIGLAVLEPT